MGAIIGVLFFSWIEKSNLLLISDKKILISAYLASALLLGIIFYFISPFMIRFFEKLIEKAEKELEKVPFKDLTFGSIGLIFGLIIAYFISQPILKLDFPIIGSALGVIIAVFVYIAFGALGLRLSLKSKDDIFLVFEKAKFSIDNKEKEARKKYKLPKILDTSVIIDGRIVDIINTGFLDGTIIIPKFVLEELQHIADSSDSLRRAKGRRGLDSLKVIQNQKKIKVQVIQEMYDNVKEVDSKLLSCAKELGGKILTNDYNLNKVADVMGIEVLNINELANAVKSVVVHGEEFSVEVLRDGKEANQGLAYFDDGTMIVVEDGKRFIGQTIDVVVTSVLQTAAGKMIFVRPKKDNKND